MSRLITLEMDPSEIRSIYGLALSLIHTMCSLEAQRSRKVRTFYPFSLCLDEEYKFLSRKEELTLLKAREVLLELEIRYVEDAFLSYHGPNPMFTCRVIKTTLEVDEDYLRACIAMRNLARPFLKSDESCYTKIEMALMEIESTPQRKRRAR